MNPALPPQQTDTDLAADASSAEPVTSSVLRSVRYDTDQSVLEVEFVSGRVYRYRDVPASIHRDLMAAPSKGTFFNEIIRDGYTYQQVR